VLPKAPDGEGDGEGDGERDAARESKYDLEKSPIPARLGIVL
jgi:hypothetical protein